MKVIGQHRGENIAKTTGKQNIKKVKTPLVKSLL